MGLTFREALIEVDVEDACGRLNLTLEDFAFVMRHYRLDGRSLACSVVSHAIFMGDRQPEVRDIFATQAGSERYVETLLASRSTPIATPALSPDWPALVAHACDRKGMTPDDRDFVLSALARDGDRAVDAWAERAAREGKSSDSPELLARIGARCYVDFCLWRRSRTVEALPLAVYAAAF